MAIKERKRPAHHPPIERCGEPVIIFLTVCSKDRKRVLAEDSIHTSLHQAWSEAGQWCVGHYLIMPDHIHLFCSPASRESESVVRWCGYWKRLVSKSHVHLQPLWQKDCWDTQLRSSRHYGEKWEYVRQNPVRAGLVEDADEWPYHGCLTELRW